MGFQIHTEHSLLELWETVFSFASKEHIYYMDRNLATAQQKQNRPKPETESSN